MPTLEMVLILSLSKDEGHAPGLRRDPDGAKWRILLENERPT